MNKDNLTNEEQNSLNEALQQIEAMKKSGKTASVTRKADGSFECISTDKVDVSGWADILGKKE